MKYESEESVFNMAIAYLMRIDKLLYKCQECAIGQNIDGWNAHLRGVFRELSAKLNDDELKEIEGDPKKLCSMEQLIDDFTTMEEANFINVSRLLNNPTIREKKRAVIMRLLDTLEIKIRRCLQKKGMLLPSRSDPRYAVLNR